VFIKVHLCEVLKDPFVLLSCDLFAVSPAFCDVFDIRRLMLNTCKCLCRIPLCHFGGEGVNIFYVTEIFYRKIFSDKMLLRHILRD